MVWARNVVSHFLLVSVVKKASLLEYYKHNQREENLRKTLVTSWCDPEGRSMLPYCDSCSESTQLSTSLNTRLHQ